MLVEQNRLELAAIWIRSGNRENWENHSLIHVFERRGGEPAQLDLDIACAGSFTSTRADAGRGG